MRLHRLPFAATLIALAILSAPVGCSSSDDGPSRFSLKVVAHPAGKGPSTFCSQVGSSAGTSGDNITAGRWFQTSSHTTASDGSWYDIDITGFDGNVHSWRYDEAQVRAGVTVDARYDDVGGPVDVHISGAFTAIVPCSP